MHTMKENQPCPACDTRDRCHLVARLRDNRLSLAEFWDAHAEWSQATFGTDAERGPAGPLKHLIKEANEALAHPTDLEEYADCLFLVFDAARRAGFTFEQLREAVCVKLKVNKARTWPKPTSNEPVEHVRAN